MNRAPHRRGSLLTTACFAAAVAIALAAAAAPTAAQVPSPELQGRMRDALRVAKAVRVVTPAGPFIERSVELSDGGVRLPGTPQLGETIVTPPQPSLVPWELLTSIEMRRGASDRGMLLGAAVGVAFGTLYALAPHSEQTTGGSGGRLLYAVAGAAGGAAFGSLMGTGVDSWTRIWPEADRP